MTMNYLRYLNQVALSRKGSPIRKLTEILTRSPPTMISLAGGMPNPATFPFYEISVKTFGDKTITFSGDELKVALQYSATSGLPELVSWLKELQRKFHSPPMWSDASKKTHLELIVTSGSQDGLCKVWEMMLSKGDNVLLESPAYPGTLAAVKPLGVNILSVESDNDGLKPSSLRRILSRWDPEDTKNPSSDIPKVLLLVPNAGNPSGATLTLDRRKEIYEIARKYDLIIIEDDPYFFLQFSKPYIPSFLSMDVDGRVLRSDSFSKIMSSGLRVGFLTGPKPLIDRIALHMQVSVLHASCMSQMMILNLLKEIGLDGFETHVDNVCEFYRSQKNHAVRLAQKHLEGVADWIEPQGGMFLWIRINVVKDTKIMIEEKALAKEVLLIPGCVFQADDNSPSQFLRASFSLASPEKMDVAFQRLRLLIDDEVRLSKASFAAD